MKLHALIITIIISLFFSLFNTGIFAGTARDSSACSTPIILSELDTLIELEEMDDQADTDKNDEDMDEDTTDDEDIYAVPESDKNDEGISEDVEPDSDEAVEDQSEDADEEDFTITDEKSCDTEEAAGHVIIRVSANGVENGISYIKPGAEIEFFNVSGQAVDITISPSGFATSDSFTVQPDASKSVYARYSSEVTVGKAIITCHDGTHTKYFFTICP